MKRQVTKEMALHLNYEEMQEHAIVATRQLAKRQITWCRSENNAKWYDALEKGIFPKIFENIEK